MAGAAGDNGVRRGEELERIVEVHGAILHELGEQVGGEDLGERAEAEDGVWRGPLAAAGSGIAVTAEEDFAIAHDDEHHSGGTGSGEEIGAEGVRLLQAGEEWGGLGMRRSSTQESRGECEDEV